MSLTTIRRRWIGSGPGGQGRDHHRGLRRSHGRRRHRTARRQAGDHPLVLFKELRRHPPLRYVPDRRLVVDKGVATTTGITASMPMVLTLIEAIAGRDKAKAVAGDLGLPLGCAA